VTLRGYLAQHRNRGAFSHGGRGRKLRNSAIPGEGEAKRGKLSQEKLCEAKKRLRTSWSRRTIGKLISKREKKVMVDSEKKKDPVNLSKAEELFSKESAGKYFGAKTRLGRGD